MRTFTSVLALCGLVILGCEAPTQPEASFELEPTVARAASSTPAVTGSAHFLTGGQPRTVVINAVEHVDGSVSGTMQISIKAFDAWWHTDVECVTVAGDRAFLGGTITEASDARIQVGTKSYLWVEDHGEGSAASPDRVSIAGLNETQQGLDDFCGLVQNLLPGTDVLRGNVQIH